MRWVHSVYLRKPSTRPLTAAAHLGHYQQTDKRVHFQLIYGKMWDGYVMIYQINIP